MPSIGRLRYYLTQIIFYRKSKHTIFSTLITKFYNECNLKYVHLSYPHNQSCTEIAKSLGSELFPLTNFLCLKR